MIARLGASALAFGALLFAAEGAALAQAASPGKGAIVVATSADGTAAAKPLARDVYRDEALAPGIDDATARVLAGEAPAADAPTKLKELGDLRASVSSAGSEAATRRLLAAIGSDLKARIVVSVTMEGGRPVAKVLRVETAAFEGVELGATVETAPSGEKLFQWPGALETLHKLLLAEKPVEKAGAAASPPAKKTAKAPAKGETKPAETKSIWSSPWFWGTLGGVVAVGATVFAVAKATEGDGGTLRLQGRVAP